VAAPLPLFVGVEVHPARDGAPFWFFLGKNIKKSPKLTAVCDRAPQCSKGTEVAHQTTKMYKKGHLFFLYSYNTLILLTNKIIK
jgi:hypothetical protein